VAHSKEPTSGHTGKTPLQLLTLLLLLPLLTVCRRTIEDAFVSGLLTAPAVLGALRVDYFIVVDGVSSVREPEVGLRFNEKRNLL